MRRSSLQRRFVYGRLIFIEQVMCMVGKGVRNDYLALQLIQWRSKENQSIREAARRLGIPPLRWKRWEDGKGKPAFAELMLLSALMQTPICALFPLEEMGC